MWTVGNFFNLTKADFDTLVLRGGGNGFQVVNAPNPGSEVDILASVAAAGDTLWSVGHFKDGGPRQSLIERHPPEGR